MDAIVATNVSKVFRLNDDPAASIKERMLRFGRSHYRDFVALQPMDLTVSTGQTLGILGHNGSGKSTLLKCISGILKPTTGQIQLRGRLASLLELGAGFHPELTGRENVYINAAFLGISRKEIAKRFDAIVDFAELDQFIDEPVKHYSSGMHVRLGFAVAVNLDPDVLLVDEVLAVGDEVFQRKCLDRVRQFQEEGRTIVVVTHHGQLVADGLPGDAIQVFREHLHGTLVEAPTVDEHGSLRVMSVAASYPRQSERKFIHPGEAVDVDVEYQADEPVEAATLNIAINSTSSQTVWARDFDLVALGIGTLYGNGRIRVPLTSVPLLDGTYTVIVSLTDRHRSVLTRQSKATFDVMNPTDSRGVAALGVGGVELFKGR